MCYLTTLSTNFILRFYGVGHMVKDHSDSERGNSLPPHGLLFPINIKDSLYAPSHRQDSTYHDIVTPLVEHLLELEITQWVHPMKDRSDDPSHHERTLLPLSYISLPVGLSHKGNMHTFQMKKIWRKFGRSAKW